MAYAERGFGPRWSLLAARWTQDVAPGGVHRQLVLPDGCADVILVGEEEALVVGPTACRDIVDLPGGTVLHGLRLRPGAVGTVLRTPAVELRDRVVRLRDVVRGRLADDLVRAARGDLGAAWRIEDRPASPGRPAVLALAGGAGVERTAREVALSERQLRRVVLEQAGLAPKALHRVLRLQRLLRLADRTPDTPLARLAADAGYADQAHLARETRTLCGLTPTALLAHRASGDPSPLAKQDGRNVQALV